MHEVLARRYLSARRGRLLPQGRGAAAAQSVCRHRPAAPCPDAGDPHRQVGRGAGHRERSGKDAGPDRRRLRARRLGPVSLTTPAIAALLREDVPVTFASTGGWVLGHTVSTGHRNVAIRIAQYRAAFDERRCLAFTRGLVAAKIRNARVFLRRNFKSGDEAERDAALEALVRLADRAAHAANEAELLGLEGEAAARYFRLFATMLGEAARDFSQFSFDKRTRRPPADPVNAMLSLGYALLSRTWLNVLSAVGFDPYLGFYHRPRFGRPALALDMMEPFRSILADSTVIQAINNGEVKADGFVAAGPAVNLKPAARRAFIAAYERRLDQEVTHPLFGYRVSMRRLLEVQARLLARYLAGEIDEYPHYLVR